MTPEPNPEPNVQQAVPFFMVSNMEASLRFYVDGLGFRRTKKWIVDRQNPLVLARNRRRSPSCSRSTAPTLPPTAKLGEGVSICFQCKDALAIYHEALARGLDPQRPFVGNNMWVTILTDPDGYKLDFESPTDVPEETIYSDDMELSTPTQK